MSIGMRWLFCLASLAALPIHGIAGPAAPSLEEVAQGPGKAWESFLRTAEFDGAYSAYDVLEKIAYSNEGVDPEACRTHAAQVADAVAKAPVSIAVLRAAMLCAEGTGDNAQAGKLEAALLALSREALKDGRQQPWPKPIRVLGPSDIYALLQMAGLESSYEFFDRRLPDRYFPLVVAAWDKEAGKETRYVFDYVDAVSQLKGTNEYAGYPYYRNLLTDFFVDAQAKNNTLASLDTKAWRTAYAASSKPEKIKAVRISAGYGGIQSLRLWIVICATSPFDGCTDGLADVLVGLSEKKRAVPMVMLAFLQAEGIGVKRDDALADQLLAAAARLWDEESVANEYLLLAELSERPKAAKRKALAAAMQTPATVALNASYRIGRQEKPLSVAEVQALTAAASNATGTGQSWLSEHWRQMEDEDARIRSLRLAAEAGDAGAQQVYAYYLLDKDPGQIDYGQVQQWMRTAAAGGGRSAMKYMSSLEIIRQDWKAAERWLMMAVMQDDTEALLDLARLYQLDHKEVGQTVKQAFDWYVLLGNYPDGAQARRSAARLAMRGEGTAKDPAKALQWLLKDAEAGDRASQLLLALGYLEGDFGEQGRKSAQPWIDKVMAADDNDAKIGYADWLFHRGDGSADRALGVRILTELQAAGELWAANNLAWAFCTADDLTARDPKRGLQLAESLLKSDDASAAQLDTVAACQAAAGQFSSAVETQKRAITEYSQYFGPESTAADAKEEDGYASRLRLYEQGKTFTDTRSRDPKA